MEFGPRKVVRPPATLTGRQFWRSQLRGGGGVNQDTVYFTGPQFVFTGTLEDAWPVCTAASEDCKPYTFDPKTGALTINGAAATLEGDWLTVDGKSHWELGRAKAGARWDIVLTHANASGICPLYCFARTEHLRFMPDGNFVRSSVSSGTGPVVDWAVVPDDSKGTYEVTADGLLRLAYDLPGGRPGHLPGEPNRRDRPRQQRVLRHQRLTPHPRALSLHTTEPASWVRGDPPPLGGPVPMGPEEDRDEQEGEQAAGDRQHREAGSRHDHP